ncbi:hypothetical protein [Siccirubricoccus phaeus]|uniref:hypothetical protein n=1 Tax=Siccirubricoccus phaeus TaxID=2595053 RepID=UPI00165CD24A|nr:hypothetical protein [Siccirubricoccus phaeus]
MDSKVDWILQLPDDFDSDADRLSDALCGVGHIGEGAQDEGEAPPGRPQQREVVSRSLEGGRMALQDQRAAISVHHGVPLATLNLLASVVAPRSPASLLMTLWLSITAAEGLACVWRARG